MLGVLRWLPVRQFSAALGRQSGTRALFGALALAGCEGSSGTGRDAAAIQEDCCLWGASYSGSFLRTCEKRRIRNLGSAAQTGR